VPRGGYRGGVKPKLPNSKKRMHVTCRLKPENKEWIESQKYLSSKSVGEIIDMAIEILKLSPSIQE